jgi:nicotinamidase-related amidase
METLPLNPTPLCDANQSQLLIIDIQERLAAAMAEETRDAVLKNTALLLQGASLLQIPVVRTEQYPQGLGPTEKVLLEHFPEKSKEFEKTSFSCCGTEGFCETGLDPERKQVIVTGMETHVCVLQTAMELQQRGLQVFVVADAACSRTDHNRNNALERMRDEGIIITNTESVLFEWLRDAGHEQFRTISRMLR